MSEATKQALEAALAEHVADEMGGALVNGWVLQVAAASLDGSNTYLSDYPVGQAPHATFGLVQILDEFVHGFQHEEIGSDDD